MNNETYSTEAASTEKRFPDGLVLSEIQAEILHHAMGLVTEAGEIMDAVKKNLIYGKPLDSVNLGEEVGDLAWYEAGLLRVLKKTREQIQQVNIDKLRLRYPEKFTNTAALSRNLDAERKILENGLKS